MPKRKFIFCKGCEGPPEHFAKYLYHVKPDFFSRPRVTPVCEDYIKKNNIRPSNPNLTLINEGGS